MPDRLRALLYRVGAPFRSVVRRAGQGVRSHPMGVLFGAGIFVFALAIALNLAQGPNPGAPSDEPQLGQVTYANTWDLLELTRQLEAGNVVIISRFLGPAANASGAPVKGATQQILAAQTRTGQWVKLDLTQTTVEAVSALRALGYGELLSVEALSALPPATTAAVPPANNGLVNLLTVAGMLLFSGGILMFLNRNRGSGLGMAPGGRGKPGSRGHYTIILPPDPAAPEDEMAVERLKRLPSMADIAGIDEAKQELTEVVEFLRDPAPFAAMGASIPRGVMLYGPPGTGKCVVGGTLVLTDKGIMEIERVPLFYAVNEKNGKTAGAWVLSYDMERGIQSLAQTSHWFDLGVQETRRITLRQGASIEGTLEHPVLVQGPDGLPIWRRLDQITIEDRVALHVGARRFGRRREMDVDTAYLLGLLTGDGGLTHAGDITLTSTDQEIVSFFKRYMNERHGQTVRFDGRCSYRVQSWPVKAQIMRLGMNWLLSYDKRIPDSIMQAPRDLVTAFLQGLFDSDGGWERYAVSLSTSSDRMYEQVMALLLNLGILAHGSQRTTSSGRASNRIVISGMALSEFDRLLGFRLTRKQALVRSYLDRFPEGVGQNTNLEVYSGLRTTLVRLRETMRLAGHQTPQLTQAVWRSAGRSGGSVSRRMLGRVADEVAILGGDEDAQNIRKLATSGLVFSPVTEIQSGRARVYDFTVPGTHSFWSNGLVSHNTSLAKAVAREANVAFIHTSGADFVEMYVGVGAKRIREIFSEARKLGRAVVFVDEFDALGKTRGGPQSHDEREQTLNALLAELDGFETTDGVVVLAATNRLDILDPALLRPGRFGRKVNVPNPDRVGRESILGVHAANKPLSSAVDLAAVARQTFGFSGAMLADILNEAAILAARRKSPLIEPADIAAGWLKVAMGVSRSRSMDERERSIIAVHEAGHAVCGRIHGDRRRIEKISLRSHGDALGFTAFSSEDDALPAESNLRARLIALMGGRAAEAILFHEVTGGAADDFKNAHSLAETMVRKLGMGRDPSDDGPVGASGRGTLSFLVDREGHSLPSSVVEAQSRAIATLLDEAYAAAINTLSAEQGRLELVAAYLFEAEEIDGDEFDALMENRLAPRSLTAWRAAPARPRSPEEIAAVLARPRAPVTAARAIPTMPARPAAPAAEVSTPAPVIPPNGTPAPPVRARRRHPSTMTGWLGGKLRRRAMALLQAWEDRGKEPVK